MNFIIIFCAKYLIIFGVLISGVYWLTLTREHKIRFIVFAVITAIIAFSLTKLGGALFYDQRPFVTSRITPLFPHAADNGFPSDHTVLMAVIAIIVFSQSKKLGFGLMILSIIVGVTRVLSHIHRPIDIIGSLVFALIGGVVAYFLTPKILARIIK